MLALLALPLAAASGDEEAPHRDLGPFEIHAHASLGAQWLPWVGAEAAVARLDPVNAPGVRVVQSALELELEGPVGSWATFRVEEGVVHAGGLEAAEAALGFRTANGVASAWIGRDDLPVSLDRVYEPEALVHSTRLLVSRASLPLHVGGATTQLAWPERARLRGGVAYGSAAADAPYLWARAELHPLGAPPHRQDDAVEGFALQLAGGALRHASPSLGMGWLQSADAELRYGPWLLSGGWLRFAQAQDWREAWVELGGPIAPLPEGDLHLLLRGERVTGLELGEDARYLGAARLTWRAAEAHVRLYAETLLSRELGDGVVDGEDLPSLARGVERPNGTTAVGLQFTW